MVDAELRLVVRCTAFRSPYKGVLSNAPTFAERAGAFARHLIATALPFEPQIVECLVGSKNDAPSSGELERLTRDFFSFVLRAFSADQAGRLRAEVRFDPSTQAFQLRERRDALAIDPLTLPEGKWLDWFLHAPRCPSCALFPDVTDEYLPCRLCGYAEYGADDPERARTRFVQAPETPALVAAARGLLAAVQTELAPVRATYLRYRLYELSAVPITALEPLPW